MSKKLLLTFGLISQLYASDSMPLLDDDSDNDEPQTVAQINGDSAFATVLYVREVHALTRQIDEDEAYALRLAEELKVEDEAERQRQIEAGESEARRLQEEENSQRNPENDPNYAEDAEYARRLAEEFTREEEDRLRQIADGEAEARRLQAEIDQIRIPVRIDEDLEKQDPLYPFSPPI